MELKIRPPIFHELENIMHIARIGIDIDGPFGPITVSSDVSKKVLADVFGMIVFLVENFDVLNQIVEAE